MTISKIFLYFGENTICLFPEEWQYEEAKLIALLAEDSEYAFQLLYDRHRKRIYQTGLRYLKSPILAQELVQDVFLKLWFNRKSLNADQSIEAWLYTVAKNNLVNRLKKLSREWQALKSMEKNGEAFVNNIENKLQDAQYQELLQKAIQRLPEQQRKAFILSREEQLTYIEIGEQMGISALTVKTHISRALDSIRNYFAEQGIVLSSVVLLLLL
jgi:RNA polymerase sigma-70 factor (family 1)